MAYILFFKRIKLISYLTSHQINQHPFQSEPVLLFELDSPLKKTENTVYTIVFWISSVLKPR
jgi:hypothetical protein